MNENAQKQRIGFGPRGIMLIIVLFIGFLLYQVVSNYPLNILSEDFLGGSRRVAMLMTIATFVSVAFQLVISGFMGKIKSIKRLTIIFGVLAIASSWLMAALPLVNLQLWYVVFFIAKLTVTIYVLFFMTVVAGQWFPRRKGTVIGIATIAYPVGNGVIGFFASAVYAPFSKGIMVPAIFRSFLPFMIIGTIGLVLYIIFITDYPEQCGAFRDNDRSFTPEKAQAMLEEEIENKKNTVWTTGHIFMCRDFWFASISCGLVLMAAIGALTQSSTIIGYFPNLNYTVIMMVIAVCGAFGSWLLGFLDTKIGTKKSLLITVILMAISGVFGVVAGRTGVAVLVVISLILLGIFMGASSNFNVSVAVQYWGREDFQGVYACVNPVANVFNALAPTVTAMLLFSGIQGINVPAVFMMILISGIIGIVLTLLFSPKHIKEKDDKYRAAAGKPLDDALEGRK